MRLSLSSCFLVVASAVSVSAADNLPPPAATEVWKPVRVVTAPVAPASGAPSDAVVLFDGTHLDAWEIAKGGPAPWKIENDALIVVAKTGPIRTQAAFGDIQLHLEFRTPAIVKGEGQNRGNSGVFFMGLYELQVLDSYQNETYANGQAASIYKQQAPLVNASRPSGEWQTYDVIWIAPRFAADGSLLQPARMTVFHNGILVHHDAVLKGPTVYRGTPAYQAHPAKLPLSLQDHGSPVAFRNIWVRELALIEETGF